MQMIHQLLYILAQFHHIKNEMNFTILKKQGFLSHQASAYIYFFNNRHLNDDSHIESIFIGINWVA